MKTNHTPGPWFLETNTVSLNEEIIAGDNNRICVLDSWVSNHPDGKLIAAAPELLEALLAVLNNEDGNGNISLSANGKVISEIKSAIQKATL